MTRILRIFALAALAAAAAGTAAGPASAGDPQRRASASVEFSSQERTRPRTRVQIYREPQPAFWDYPRPGTYSWPGPNAKRDCKAWYVVENRATGPTLTPRMTCRWVQG